MPTYYKFIPRRIDVQIIKIPKVQKIIIEVEIIFFCLILIILGFQNYYFFKSSTLYGYLLGYFGPLWIYSVHFKIFFSKFFLTYCADAGRYAVDTISLHTISLHTIVWPKVGCGQCCFTTTLLEKIFTWAKNCLMVQSNIFEVIGLPRDFLIDGRHSLIWDVRLGV